MIPIARKTTDKINNPPAPNKYWQKRIYVKSHIKKIWDTLPKEKKEKINQKTRLYFEYCVNDTRKNQNWKAFIETAIDDNCIDDRLRDDVGGNHDK